MTANRGRLNLARMKVRNATEADVPALAAIYNEAVLATTATYDYDPVTEDSRRLWLKDQQAQGYVVRVAEIPGDGVVGWGALSAFNVRKGYRFTVCNSLYVLGRHQGKGVGRRLLEDQLEIAPTSGWRAMIAIIDADNEVSIRLHERHDFERVAHLKEVGFKFDRWLDVVYMQRLLAK